MLVKAKNNTGSAKSWEGQEIAPGEYYLLESSEISRWACSSDVMTDIGSGDLIINDGTDDITDVNTAIDFIKGNPLKASTGEMKVIVKEEWSGETNGHYQTKGFKCDITSASGWQEFDMSFKHPVSLICAQMGIDPSMDGDEGCLCIAPYTVVGAITSNVAVDDVVITVQASVLNYMDEGYHIHLSTSPTSQAAEDNEDLGIVIAKDTDNNTITVDTASTAAFSAASPTYVKMTRHLVPEIWFKNKGSEEVHREYGRSRIGGSYIPANTTIRLMYNNISAVAHTLILEFEYLY